MSEFNLHHSELHYKVAYLQLSIRVVLVSVVVRWKLQDTNNKTWKVWLGQNGKQSSCI